jgi:ankyrin repeat protein
MDLGASFIDVTPPYEDDHLVFILAQNFGYGYTPQKFELLLNRGFSIYDRNDQGKTCLHACLHYARLSRNEKESLILLVRRGADVHAVDYSGMSISDVAYSASCGDKEDGLGGYRGDLWDAVLSECGHDISEMRKDYPRIPHYTSKYTRERFEGLWLDREEFCPYYNDPLEWDPEESLDSLQDSKESMSENDEDNEEVLSENDGDKELSSILGNDSAIAEDDIKESVDLDRISLLPSYYV